MDVILYWNDIALEANRISHTTGLDTSTLGPTLSSRSIAIIHLAMYDAYARVINNAATLPVYDLTSPLPPAGVTAQGAATGAAHQALMCLYPSLREMLGRFRQCAPGAYDAIGLAYGVTVANHLLGTRANDPDASSMGFVQGQQAGQHRADPDNPSQGFHGPKYGCNSKTFGVKTWHQLDAPYALASTEYSKAIDTVRGLGIAPELAGTLPSSISYRNSEQSVIGVYWGYDGAANIGTPMRLYNQIVRQVALEQGNTEAKNAKLFALVNAAMADAGILAWAEKYKHNFWRPVVAIRENDKSMGPSGVAGNNVNQKCDVNWLPLGAPSSNSVGRKNFTPPFPAYPSGHATFGAATLHITRLFYGFMDETPDNLLSQAFVSDEFNGNTVDNKGTVRPRHTRKFQKGLWDMIIENGISRVYLGVHWPFDAFAVSSGLTPDLSKNIGGVPLGLNIAKDIFNSSLNPGWKSNLSCPFSCPTPPPPHV